MVLFLWSRALNSWFYSHLTLLSEVRSMWRKALKTLKECFWEISSLLFTFWLANLNIIIIVKLKQAKNNKISAAGLHLNFRTAYLQNHALGLLFYRMLIYSFAELSKTLSYIDIPFDRHSYIYCSMILCPQLCLFLVKCNFKVAFVTDEK